MRDRICLCESPEILANRIKSINRIERNTSVSTSFYFNTDRQAIYGIVINILWFLLFSLVIQSKDDKRLVVFQKTRGRIV